MKQLIFDTSTKTLGVAVTNGLEVLAEETIYEVKNHSKYLMPQIEKLMQLAGVRPIELDAIIVAEGPGSYTGVRIGVTVSKTLAWTLNIPLYAVSSLQGMAQSYAGEFDGLLIPLIDARRGTVFTGAYRQNGSVVECVLSDRHMDFVDWVGILKEQDEPVCFIGADAAIYQEEIAAQFGQQFDNNLKLQVSKYIFLTEAAQPVEIHTFVPKYLRLAEAEQKWLEQNKGMTVK